MAPPSLACRRAPAADHSRHHCFARSRCLFEWRRSDHITDRFDARHRGPRCGVLDARHSVNGGTGHHRGPVGAVRGVATRSLRRRCEDGHDQRRHRASADGGRVVPARRRRGSPTPRVHVPARPGGRVRSGRRRRVDIDVGRRSVPARDLLPRQWRPPLHRFQLHRDDRQLRLRRRARPTTRATRCSTTCSAPVPMVR